MVKSRVQRISKDLVDELQSIAKRNDIKIVEASREVAKLLRQNKQRKIIKEIQF